MSDMTHESTESADRDALSVRVTGTGRVRSSRVEVACWYTFAAGVTVAVIAAIVVTMQFGTFGGNTFFPMVWIGVGICVAGVGLLPALVLTGVRQMLNSAPAQHSTERIDEA